MGKAYPQRKGGHQKPSSSCPVEEGWPQTHPFLLGCEDKHSTSPEKTQQAS